MSGWDWLLLPRVLPWDDALQCELGGPVAALLAMDEHVRKHR